MAGFLTPDAGTVTHTHTHISVYVFSCLHKCLLLTCNSLLHFFSLFSPFYSLFGITSFSSLLLFPLPPHHPFTNSPPHLYLPRFCFHLTLYFLFSSYCFLLPSAPPLFLIPSLPPLLSGSLYICSFFFPSILSPSTPSTPTLSSSSQLMDICPNSPPPLLSSPFLLPFFLLLLLPPLSFSSQLLLYLLCPFPLHHPHHHFVSSVMALLPCLSYPPLHFLPHPARPPCPPSILSLFSMATSPSPPHRRPPPMSCVCMCKFLPSPAFTPSPHPQW